MITEPLTADELRRQVQDVLSGHGWTVDEFATVDIDDISAPELRDLWLMVKGALF